MIEKTPKPEFKKLTENYDAANTDGKLLTQNGFEDFFDSKDKTLCGFV